MLVALQHLYLILSTLNCSMFMLCVLVPALLLGWRCGWLLWGRGGGGQAGGEVWFFHPICLVCVGDVGSGCMEILVSL